MIILRKTQNENGTYDNQTWNGPTPPDGYYEVPQSLEADWKSYAPFAKLTVVNGVITAISDNPEARASQAAIVDNTAEIAELKQQLDATDYKIIKSYEYSLVGLELPYDITALHTERQALRDRITLLEGV